MKSFFLCSLLLLSGMLASAQLTHVSDFSWGNLDSNFVSTDSFLICEGLPMTLSLSTSLPHRRNLNQQGNPLSNGHPTTSVLIPYPNLVTPLMVSVTLTFSQPVANLNLLIRDLDDDMPSVGPEETFSNFRINGLVAMPNIAPTAGNYQALGMVVNPLAANCNGWFSWPTNNIYSLSFDYDRVIENYAFLLDSIKFDCNETFVGMAGQAPRLDLEAGPSPAHSQLMVKVGGSINAPTEIALYNALGHRVLQSSTSDRLLFLDVSQLPSGPYFLTATQSGNSTTRKIAVQR